MILCTSFTIISAGIFLFTIISDKTCHTVSMVLAANTILTELVTGSNMFGIVVITTRNDLQDIYYENSFCIFQGYMTYVMTCLQNWSYTLQAIQRYITVVYPMRLSWQSIQFQIFLICLTWIFGIVCPLPLLLTHQIKYNLDNKICQMPLQFSFLTVYNALCVYMIPHSSSILTYFGLVRYVQEMSDNVSTANVFKRAQRELKMVRRIIILILGITMMGFPYLIFIFISFFTNPPKYHFRIAYYFVNTSLLFVMIALFQFTELLKTSLLQIIFKPTNTVLSMNI